MKRRYRNAFVLEGEDLKARLMAERVETGSAVHVDWLRWTCNLRNVPLPSVDHLFPSRTISIWDEQTRTHRLNQLLQELPEGLFSAAAQALELAEEVCTCLGDAFGIAPEVRKGHDFYKHRWAIERNGCEVGWVGYGASSASPKQQAQARTLHVNLFGAACTFAANGWRERMAQLVDARHGEITRCDLAVDYFDGLAGGMLQVRADYKAGLMDVGGKRLKCNFIGDWSCDHAHETPMEGRSFYFGSKEAGKQTNVYEKGHQLYGVDAGSPWIRVELRYGNKLRDLPTDLLRRPADFFAVASDWHKHMLTLAGEQAQECALPTRGRLALETVQAEVHRNLKWVFDVAAPSLALAFHHLGDGFMQLVSWKKSPGRLSKFSPSELATAFETAKQRFCGDDNEFTPIYPPSARPAHGYAV